MPRPMAVIGTSFFFTLTLLCGGGIKAVPVCVIAASAGFVSCVFSREARENAVIPAALLSIAAASLFFEVSYRYDYLPAIKLSGENVSVSGRLADLPAASGEKYRYTIKCDSIGDVQTDGLKLSLSVKNKLDIEPYDKISFTGTVYPVGANSINSQNYYRSRSVYLGGYTNGGITVTKTDDRPIMYHILALRKSIISSINSFLPTEEGGVVTAMLTGNKEHLSSAALEAFVDSGVSHLFSVSGLHMTLWAMSVLRLLERLRINKRLAAVLAAAFTLFFIALTGFSSSCVRAGIMTLVILVGRIISRDADSVNSLGLAVLIICLINPFGAGYVGLQLSFLSTFGLLTLSPAIYRAITAGIKAQSRLVKKAILPCAVSFSISLSSMIFSLPILITEFTKVSLIAPVSNLLMVFPAAVCMFSGGLISVFSHMGVLSFLANAAALISGLFAKYLLFVSRLLAGLPYAHIRTGERYFRIWLACSMILTAAALVLARYNRKTLRMAAALCAATFLVGFISFDILNIGSSEIKVIDTGGGSAVLVSKGEKAALFGCGGDYFARDSIVRALRETGSDGLDFLLLPRSEQTESGAAEGVLSLSGARFLAAPERADTFSAIDLKHGISYSKSFSYELWSGFKAEYIYTENISAAYLDIDGTTALIIFYPGCDVSTLPQSWLAADILICRAVPPRGIDASQFGAVVISSSGDKSIKAAKNINALGGNAFTTETGSVTVRSRGDSVCSIDVT
jgi:competence protein ComEC